MDSAPPDTHRAVVSTPASLLGARDRRVMAHSPLQGPAACTRVRERRSNAQLMRNMSCCADLPDEVLGQRVLAHPDVDAAARLALFRACHALARTMLLHGPGTKRRTAAIGYRTGEAWSATLARLLRAKWQPLPPGSVDLELCITSTIDLGSAAPQPHLPPPPPASLSLHVSHLHLRQCHLTAPRLAAWRLHDAALWPHLQHLTIEECALPIPPHLEPSPLQPIPHLQSLTWQQQEHLYRERDVTALLPLVSNAWRLRVAGMENTWGAAEKAALLTHLPHLTHVELGGDGDGDGRLARALLQRPAVRHVVVGSLPSSLDLTHPQWAALDVGRVRLTGIASLPLASLERLTVRRLDCGADMTGLPLLQQLHADGTLALAAGLLELSIASTFRLQSPQLQPPLPPQPPAFLSQHLSHLQLHQCRLTAPDLAAWQLHDATLWPHLRHLTVEKCYLSGPAPPNQPLPPIPQLQSFTWVQREWDAPFGDADVLLPLVSNVRRLCVSSVYQTQGADAAAALAQLPHLTHFELGQRCNGAVATALMQHPTLEHVVVSGFDGTLDLSQQPCRWRTLELPGGVSVSALVRLPLANLQRLSIRSALSADHTAQSTAGVALLQQLHAGGRLVLLPGRRRAGEVELKCHSNGKCFSLGDAGPYARELLRLVLAAGQGVCALYLDWRTASLSRLRLELAPALQGSGRVRALCFCMADEDVREWPGAWFSGLLGALPACITHVEFTALLSGTIGSAGPVGKCTRALVQGGVASLTHPLHLTLVDSHVTPELEAELQQLAAGEAAGGGQQPLTVEVVQRDEDEW